MDGPPRGDPGQKGVHAPPRHPPSTYSIRLAADEGSSMQMACGIGVDGCRAGWFFVAVDACGRAAFGLRKCVSSLWESCRCADVVLIDIPIGLVSGTGAGRLCDAAARRMLSPRRHASIFSPPCRQALSARTYAEACRINQRACGKKLSIQAWRICGKIKEVDDFLRRRPEAVGILRETHPEICFQAMACGIPMAHGKKSAAGQAERLDLLERFWPQARTVFRSALENYRRRDLARDDIIDAMANAMAAVRLKEGLAVLPQNPPRDECGLLMEIVYARMEVHGLL